MLGEDEVVITGGVENMSMAPYLAKDARFGLRMRDSALVDSCWEVLKDPITGLMMGQTAENIAKRHGITREDQDKHALGSNQKALKAIAEGKLKQQIVPVEVKSRKGTVVFDTDEHPKDTTLEALGKLPAAFVKEDGTVTAGNASGINDGAAALIIMSEKRAQDEGIKPLGRIVSYAVAGVDPAYMGYGPVPSSRKALERAGMAVSDIDVWEINELGVDPERANLWGGAVAYGHPVGATGGRLIATILEILAEQDATTGCATLCIGGGQGVAMIVERL
jgi:acetyl-CoA C-acetyltransferase